MSTSSTPTTRTPVRTVARAASLVPGGPRQRGVVTPVQVGAAVLVVAILAGLPLVLSSSALLVAQRAVVLALFGLAFNVVFGAADMPSLGHAALFGVGGYAAGLGLERWGWSMPTVVVVALLAGAALGLVMGVATLRTDGIHLLLLTLAIAQAVWGLAFQQVRITGGDNGIAGIDRSGMSWFGSGVASFYWSSLVVIVLAVVLLWWFDVSAAGTVVKAVGMSPSRLQALGYRVGGWRTGAFVLSGSVSALAGLLYALSNRFVSPDNLAWQWSAEVMLFAILGGAAWFAGPAVGAVLLVAAESMVSDLTDRWLFVLGALYVLTMVFMPDGVLGAAGRWRDRRRGDRSDRRHMRPGPGPERTDRRVPDVDGSSGPTP